MEEQHMGEHTHATPDAHSEPLQTDEVPAELPTNIPMPHLPSLSGERADPTRPLLPRLPVHVYLEQAPQPWDTAGATVLPVVSAQPSGAQPSGAPGPSRWV